MKESVCFSEFQHRKKQSPKQRCADSEQGFLSKQPACVSVCVCLSVRDSEMSVTGTVQSTSAAFNSLLSKNVFRFIRFCVFFLVSFLLGFALIIVSPRPKKSDFFSTGLPFFFYSVWLL